MKKLATLIALAALAAGCSSTNNANLASGNGNTGVVANGNANSNANNANTANVNNANANRRAYNANISEADYEREKARYGTEAKEAGDSIGSGLKDGYLHVKTKGALFAVDDLRDSTINVDVDNGAITLRGTVANAAQKAAAVKAANGIEGKKSVKDELKIAADGSGGAANANNTKGGTGAQGGNANR